jgi:type II secretory pathway component GspD/PulD (secretin)
MNHPIRILLLGICAAVGLALAIGMALQAPMLPLPADESLAELAKGELKAAKPAKLPLPEAAPAAPAPPLAIYTNQIKSLEETIELLHRNQQRQQRQMSGVLDDLRDELDASHRRIAQTEPRRLPPEEPPPPEPPAPLPPAKEPERMPAEALPPPPAPLVHRDEGDDRLELKLQDSDIRDVLEMLSKELGLNIIASKSVSGPVTATLNGVTAETALAAVLKSAGYVGRQEGNILYVGTATDLEAIDQAADRLVTRVYRPNYIRAADLSALIVPLLTPAIGKSTVSAPAAIDNPSDQIKTGGDSYAGNEVVIVRDYEAVVLNIDELVQEVDTRPRQVSIEAMILSVKLSDTTKMGINFQTLRNNQNVAVVSGVPPTTMSDMTKTTGGIKLGFLDSSLALLLDALETVGETNVIASPRLMCLNKQRAEIQIGEQLGYVNTTVTQNAATQTVAFLDVGTLLRIRPNIASDHMVRLEIHPEVSSGSVKVESGLTLPNKSVTQVTTNVMCPDGATLVLGGLLKEDVDKQITQIPWLGSLPIAGPLFRAKQDKIDRLELICLLTPHIVGEETICEEGNKFGSEFAARQQTVLDKSGKLSKRSLGLRYLRYARAAYAAADYKTALKQVNMSIHFDPQSRDATTLREEILVAGGFEDESVHEYLKVGIWPGTRAHKDYTKQGYPWKKGTGFDDHPPQPETLAPGEPTPSRTIVRQPPAPRE